MSLDQPPAPHQMRRFPIWLGMFLASSHFLLLVYFAASRPDIGPPRPPGSEPPGVMFMDPYHSTGETVVAGRILLHGGEPAILDLIWLLDLPALLLSAAICSVVHARGVGLYATSWVAGISWLLLGSLQWFWLGFQIAARLLSRLSRPPRPIRDA